MNNTTLKEISNVLGLSISTVSRALKNHPDISDKTKQRVTELAQALDYEPNANAINLRSSKSRVFGLVVPSISNYFYHSFISSVEEESRQHNYSLMILQSGDDSTIELANLKLCRQNRISGLFTCYSTQATDLQAYTKMQDLDIPVIFFDKVPETNECIKVSMADESSAQIAATTILLKKKKKVLCMFGNANMLMTRKRMSAFIKTIDNKIELIICHANNANEAEQQTIEALTQKPDTIFCMSDELLTGVMKAIQKKALKIPVEISVIALSNGFIPNLYFPEITYAETSGYKLGKAAFKRMMECLDGNHTMEEIITASTLVEGGSI